MYNLIYIIGGLFMIVIGVVCIATLTGVTLCGGVFFFIAGMFFFLLGTIAQIRGVH